MVGGVTETWVVFGTNSVQKGPLMAPFSLKLKVVPSMVVKARVDQGKTMNILVTLKSRMTLRPEAQVMALKGLL